MAKKKKEEKVVEEIVETTEKQEEQQPIAEEAKSEETKPKEVKSEEKDVVKVKMKKLSDNDSDNTIKIDLTKPVEETTEVETQTSDIEETDTPVVEEITHEETTEALEEAVEKTAEVVTEAITEHQETGKDLPENIQKVVNFIDETGGDLEDYVKLNQDYSKLDNQSLLFEYYKKSKPHLDNDEINFLMDDKFSYEEGIDEDHEIKRKKLALKEQVADAKKYLENTKSKYYAEIKGGSKLTQNQQEAINFYEGWKNEEKSNKEFNENAKSTFLNRTNKFFGDQFKGFEYNVGDKRFRFNVKDSEQVKTTQSDINNFIGKFLDDNSVMKDAAGYHKSLFTAMNPDVIANHFYEQGKADAMKDSMAKSKNINMQPRQSHGEVKDNSGIKVRVLQDDTSPTFKFKQKKY
jgi:hypothetical protein